MSIFKACAGVVVLATTLVFLPNILAGVVGITESLVSEFLVLEPQAEKDRPLIDIEETDSNITKAAYVLESFFILNPTADREEFRIGDNYIESSKSEGLIALETELEAIAKSENLPPATVTFSADYKGFKIVVPNESNPTSPKILYDSIDEELTRTTDTRNSW